MNETDFEQDEKLIAEGILNARKVQEYIWGRLTAGGDGHYDPKLWSKMFGKRVDKISELNTNHPHYKVELRKRILQQAALSIRALKILDNEI